MSQGDRVDNLAQALKAFRTLVEAGFAPICPQLTFFAEPFIKLAHQDWLAIDLPWVAVADYLLRLPGKSAGAEMEVKYAIQHSIPVMWDIETLLANVPPTVEKISE